MLIDLTVEVTPKAAADAQGNEKKKTIYKRLTTSFVTLPSKGLASTFKTSFRGITASL